jgi:hypothetical protein
MMRASLCFAPSRRFLIIITNSLFSLLRSPSLFLHQLLSSSCSSLTYFSFFSFISLLLVVYVCVCGFYCDGLASFSSSFSDYLRQKHFRNIIVCVFSSDENEMAREQLLMKFLEGSFKVARFKWSTPLSIN